jgi:hypothetical protein
LPYRKNQYNITYQWLTRKLNRYFAGSYRQTGIYHLAMVVPVFDPLKMPLMG